ncbi:hypothetical protein [Peribacillus aracenensis]|nr:hypothetical protein [Peribacillus sp. BBB004]
MDALIEEYGRGYAMIRKAIEGLAEEELRSSTHRTSGASIKFPSK